MVRAGTVSLTRWMTNLLLLFNQLIRFVNGYIVLSSSPEQIAVWRGHTRELAKLGPFNSRVQETLRHRLFVILWPLFWRKRSEHNASRVSTEIQWF